MRQAAMARTQSAHRDAVTAMREASLGRSAGVDFSMNDPGPAVLALGPIDE